MDDRLADLTARLLDAARAAGAAEADALAVAGTSLSADVKDGRLEHAERSETIEIGLRVILGRRQACVSASDISQATITTMAERAVAMAREAPEDPTVGLADPDALSAVRDADGLDLVDPGPEPDPAALQAMAMRAEAAALAVDGVSMLDQASAAYGRRSAHLAATNGFAGRYARTDHALSCVAITGSGSAMDRDWASEMRIHAADLPSPEEVGRLAGERAAARRGARKPPTGAVPVLFDERVAASLVGHLLSATSGSAVVRGATWARDLLGRQVLPAGLTLTDDPLRPRSGASRPFDSEGLPTRRRDIVADGILTGWTLDLGTARKLGLESTGNAHRGPSSPPVAVELERRADAGQRQPRRPDPRHGNRPSGDGDAGRVDQRDDRRLFPRRLGLLGRERRDRLAGERMHHRGKPARHAADAGAGQ